MGRNGGAAARLETARQRAHDCWAARHPGPARSERALRKAEAAAVRDFGHKVNGTTETHAKAARTRQGAVARLFQAGDLSIDQLGSAQEIAAAAEAIGRGLGVRTVSLETRVDGGRRDGAFFEALGAVRRELAYTAWRAALRRQLPPGLAPAVLAVVVDDLGVSLAAKRWRMRNAAMKALLRRALELWPGLLRAAREAIDEPALERAQARVLG